MKTIPNILMISLFILSGSLLFTGCRDKTFEEITYVANVPVYMELTEFRSAVKKSEPQSLVNPGKIYFKDNLLYINENQEGVHIINNSNPASPQFLGFIEIPGNVDIAIRGNILYADSYIDLVAIDITDPLNPVEIDRVEDAFPNVIPVPDYSYPIYGLDFSKGVVVGWQQKEVTEVIENGSSYRNGDILFDNIGAPSFGSAEISINPGSTGVGGSMARFTIINNFMYAVHNDALKTFDITNTPGITSGQDIQLNRMVETIFPLQEKLFLGTTTGMLVYDISNPSTPTFISEFNHINSCDPVVVQGNYAYVTLRSGTQCGGFTNQLDVVDISSITNPFLVKSYPMFNPHGLGIDNNILFICDGEAGLKVYDATDPMEIHMNQIAHFPGIKAFDVIPLDGILMMIGADGLFQYDYSDSSELILISHIQVNQP
ncbi:MAG: hypothetical protein Q8S18_14955 [Bacteroidales bacterium]|nr:hypothetical protein [Bacteroidales bacterium]